MGPNSMQPMQVLNTSKCFSGFVQGCSQSSTHFCMKLYIINVSFITFATLQMSGVHPLLMASSRPPTSYGDHPLLMASTHFFFRTTPLATSLSVRKLETKAAS